MDPATKAGPAKKKVVPATAHIAQKTIRTSRHGISPPVGAGRTMGWATFRFGPISLSQALCSKVIAGQTQLQVMRRTT
jgi:hypothetical protein